MPILEARALSKRFGGFQAVSEISFTAEEHDVVAIIGPNGAGKTTLFRMLTGEIRCTSGECHFAGENVTRLSAAQRVAAGMGRTFQVARVFSHFTVLENMVVAIEARNRTAGIRGHAMRVEPSEQVLDEAAGWLEDLGLIEHWSGEAGKLSLGDRKRLELAMVLALEPRMLFLDEPTAGMSSFERGRIIELIERLRREHGLSIVLTEHDMGLVFRLSDHLIVMNQGQMVAQGLPLEVREDPIVRELYLGKEAVHA